MDSGDLDRSSETNLVDLVEESLVSSRCLTNNLEPVSREFVVLGSGLAFGKLVDFSSNLNSRFESECESIVGLRLCGIIQSVFDRRRREEERDKFQTHETTSENALQVTSTISEDDESHTTLLPQPMHPTKDSDPLSPLFDSLTNLDLLSGSRRFFEYDRFRLFQLLGLCNTFRLSLLFLPLA